MVSGYIALFHPPQAGSAWGVTFPDLVGCVSTGASYEEAHANAHEALAGHIAAMIADGEAPPAPRRFEAIWNDPAIAEDKAEGAVASLVHLNHVVAPKERINIMMDRGVLRRIDQAARAEGISRSAFLERAAAGVLVE